MYRPSGRSIPTITTMLTRDERIHLDAAGNGVFDATHRESVEDVLRDLRAMRARMVVLSTAFCRQEPQLARIARVVREFPQVPTVALISRLDQGTARAVLTLGQCGIRTLVDIREPTGWRELRELLSQEQATEISQVAVAQLVTDLRSAPPGARRFFEALFRVAGRGGTMQDLSAALHVLTSTLVSRFFRMQLPPPRRYLAYARLVYAARLFENPGLSIASVALQLDYSSSQSFSRHVRTTLGLSATDFRRRYDSRGMVQRLRDDLVLGYRTTWEVFDPLLTRRSGRSSPGLAPPAPFTPE